MGASKSSVSSATSVTQRSRTCGSAVTTAPAQKSRCTRRVLFALAGKSRDAVLLPTAIVSHVYSFLGALDHCGAARTCRHFSRCAALPASSPHELTMPLLPPLPQARQLFGADNCQCADMSFPGVTVHWRPVRVRFPSAPTSGGVRHWLTGNERLQYLELMLDRTRATVRTPWTLPSTLTELVLSDAFDEDEVWNVLATCRHSLRRLSLAQITFATCASFLEVSRACTQLRDLGLRDVRVRDSSPHLGVSAPAPKLAQLDVTDTEPHLFAPLIAECADSLRALSCSETPWTPLQFRTSVARCRVLHTFSLESARPRAALLTELPPTIRFIRIHALYDVTQDTLARLPRLTHLYCKTIGDGPYAYDRKRVFVNVRHLYLVTVSDSPDNYGACRAYLTAVLPCVSTLVVPRSLNALVLVLALCRSQLPIRNIVFAGASSLSDRMIRLSLDRFPNLSYETYSGPFV